MNTEQTSKNIFMYTYNLFAINVEVIVGCSCRSNLWTFRPAEVITRITEMMQEKI